MLCGIPLALTWRYCQWYWQCLHIQTKGALIICINCCHLLELTLLCLVNLWKLDESISNFKGAWCIYFYFISYRNTCLQTVKILITRLVLRRLIWACTVCLHVYVHFNTTLCKSGLSNEPYILWPERIFFFLFKHNKMFRVGVENVGRVGKPETHTYFLCVA